MENKPEINLYNKFIDSLELLEDYISDFSWKRYIDKIDPKKKITLDMTLEHVDPKIGNNFFICGNTLTVKGLDVNKKVQFKVKGTVLLRIACNVEIDEQCVKYYSENTVQLTTVPAFRTLVKEALMKMGLPPFTLPFLKRKGQLKAQ